MKCSVILSVIAASILSLASGQEGGHKDNYEPSPYHYEYTVHDDKEYLDFGAKEEGDGEGNVHGQYHVQLPDGRLQHVSYHVDDYNGYTADVSYDGHAEHLIHHGIQSLGGNHGHHNDGGHRFGKTLGNVDDGQRLSVNEGHHRLGETISAQSEDHIISNGFTNSRSGKTIVDENSNHNSNEVHAKPVQSFPSSGDFSHRFGNPSNTFSGTLKTEAKQSVQSSPSRDFSNRFGEPSIGFSGNSGQFKAESNKPANSFFSRSPIEPQQSHVSKTTESFDTGFGTPVKTFSSFGNEPIKQENSFFNSGKDPSHSHAKDSFSRHGKSGRQDVDEQSSNLFGSSSQSKPVVHFESTNEKKNIHPPKKIINRFGEPKTNNFFDSVGSFGGKSSKPDFDSFSPIFGKSSNSNGFQNQPKKSFESFSPIFGKKSPNIFASEPLKSDTDFFKPSGSFSSGFDKPSKPSGSFKSSEAFIKPVGSSGFPARPATLNNSFPVHEQIAPKLSTKQLPSSNKISHPKLAQSAPRFKARAIGLGRNHPVLKNLDINRQSSHNKSNGQRGSDGNQSAVGQQGSFRQPTDRRQFGRALFDESLRQESLVEQKLQGPRSDNPGHRAFITHKAIPV